VEAVVEELALVLDKVLVLVLVLVRVLTVVVAVVVVVTVVAVVALDVVHDDILSKKAYFLWLDQPPSSLPRLDSSQRFLLLTNAAANANPAHSAVMRHAASQSASVAATRPPNRQSA